MVETIIDDIIRREGNFINHPNDRGGPTKYGITAKTLGGWLHLGRLATSEEVAVLTEAEAREIYRHQYIVEPGFDAITHPALQALLVDSGVHSDPRTAVHWLQTALSVVADGVIGPKTLAAIAATDQNKLYRKVLAARVRHLGRLITNDPKQSVFAAGWMNRMAEFVEGTV
ncbi:glycoside hydrolase family 108 protein [Nitrosomonas communis]|uniref:Predicted Peptidoglycan domain-containing protein n=1 Tax=Nitrosomonas communis TaxID=44574 RepID=A0A1I4LRX4_9PROT|nr:glycosyl hydrolase 108 family protein [Nitrosomonas communis]SFL93699.1 Predicted Peptidoglycan domain-containing protein [Nitrosomonas communis]